MRIGTGLFGLLLAVGLAGTVAGCAGSDDGNGVATAGNRSTASASAKADGLTNQERALKFGQCMRDNGVPNFADPEVGDNGEMRLEFSAPEGDGTAPDKDTVDAAMNKCKQYLPNGGEPPKLDAAAMEQQRKFAKCMRDNGVPKFPDPGADGGLMIDGNAIGMGPGDPTFEAAQKKCEQFQPARPSGDPGSGTQTRTNG